MNRKLIVTDMDGTLLGKDYLLSDYSKTILRELEEAGNLVVLCSGRPERSITPYYHSIGLKNSPFIAYNGILIVDGTSDENLFIKKFPHGKVIKIIENYRDILISISLETKDTLYLFNEDKHLNNFFPYDGMKVIKDPKPEEIKEDLFTFIFKVDDNKYPALEKEIFNKYGLYLRHWTHEPYAELYWPDATKKEAVEFLKDMYQIKTEDIIAFGDSLNDDGMLSVAGISFVSLDSKSNLLKEKYLTTIDTAKNDGVAKTLATLFKL